MIEIVNSLHLGPGPMIRFNALSGPRNRSLRLTLSQIALREAEALVDFRCTNAARDGRNQHHRVDWSRRRRRGDLAPCVRSIASAIASRSEVDQPGSVLTPRTSFGRWQRRRTHMQCVDDATISVLGMVRGQVEFSARCDGNPGSSRVADCQAPLADSDSCGGNRRIPPPTWKTATTLDVDVSAEHGKCGV